MTRTGIIIRTFNEADLLPKTLDAIMRQVEQCYKIIAVDSGSTDDTVKIIKSFKDIHLIEIPKSEFSYGRALNLGINAVAGSATYAAMLSAHAIPCDRDWLRELIRPMEENSGVAGVYGKQIPLPEHSSNPIVRALSVEAYPTSYGSKPFITNRSSFFSNANSAIRVEHWRVNHFDEDVDYCEDRLWARSTIAEGGLIAYQPAAAVYHSHPDNFSLFFNRMYREIKTMRTHDPVQYPLLTKRELIKNLKFLLISYIRESLKNRSPRGLQWDLFRYKSIIELSSYIARKDAEIG